MKGYEFKEDILIINRELTDLDHFVDDFLNILKSHSDYLIVNGFVSISTGRVRGTEDVDVLVPIMDKSHFKTMFEDLLKNKFWCYQTDSYSEAYTYFKKFNSLRFAREGEMFPNMEVVPIDETKKAKYFEFSNPQKIKIKNFEFKIPWLEFEIIYKEKVLGSKKDFEDAKHLRTFFSEVLNKQKFDKSLEAIKNEIS